MSKINLWQKNTRKAVLLKKGLVGKGELSGMIGIFCDLIKVCFTWIFAIIYRIIHLNLDFTVYKFYLERKVR